MRRRTLLTATAAAGPAALLMSLDEALAQPPSSPAGGEPLDARLVRARALYDTGAHQQLLAALPNLIADAHSAAASRDSLDQARLSTVYSLASALLVKMGSYDRARLTADRAHTWAEVSGSPLAAAAATRELAIVLRHQERHDAAQRLMTTAAADVEATGLRTEAAAAAYAQMLCTLAYTAARNDQRAEALAMTEEARRAARRLPATAPTGRLFNVSPATVDLYAVGIHWALGDAGAALEAGRNLRPEHFPTAERRARMQHRPRPGLVGLATPRTNHPRPPLRLPHQPSRGPRPPSHPPPRPRTHQPPPTHHRSHRTPQRPTPTDQLNPRTPHSAGVSWTRCDPSPSAAPNLQDGPSPFPVEHADSCPCHTAGHPPAATSE